MSSTHSNDSIFALVDCNSFYCSCERVFNPKIAKRPVVVLSNNDGIIIARTQEAKDLGIKMGDAFHLVADTIKKHKVAVFSSNFSLYGDMSDRVMNTLHEFSPEVEIYSIDEAFLNFSGFGGKDLIEYGHTIRNQVLKETGIPVSVGIAPSKVLAKMANVLAKSSKSGVVSLVDREERENIFATFPVDKIWGIGRKSAEKLEIIGIKTARDLQIADPDKIQKILTIVGRRITEELNGVSCLSLELMREDKKQIISSRSFGQPVFRLEELQEACSNYVTRASEKLRMQDSVCGEIKVFVLTNRFKNITQYYNTATVKLPEPTSASHVLSKAIAPALAKIFRPGIEYKKAGIILNHITPAKSFQLGIFSDKKIRDRDHKIMGVLDHINEKFGGNTLKLASCGTTSPWKMRSSIRSPCYTTNWKELLSI